MLGRDVFEGPRLGRRERKKVITRADLVRAGRTLFSSEGIYEVRIEDLAERAGIGKGTLYLYFANKQDLVQAVVEGGFQELETQLDAAATQAASFPELMDEIVRAYTQFFASNPDLQRIFHQVRGILKFHRPEWLPVRVPLEKHIGYVARLLARTPSAVRERPAQRKAMALVLFGAVSGACSVRAALESGPAPEAWSNLLRRGLAGLSGGLTRGGAGRRRGRVRGAKR